MGKIISNININMVYPTMSKAAHRETIDRSGSSSDTVDADESRRSSLLSDYPYPGHQKGCLTIKTQRESLACPCIQSPPCDDPASRNAVRFDTVEFRVYDLILSDHPATTSGPPLGIGWRYDPRNTLVADIETYEAHRDAPESRRTKAELLIPAQIREDMLREFGYSRNEMRAVAKSIQKDQEQRRKAYIRQQKIDMISKSVGSARNGFKNNVPNFMNNVPSFKGIVKRDSRDLLR